MPVLGSVFFDFQLPTAATLFYFSLLLAVALFFKFTRLLSMRNWDVLTLFLLVPGLLLIQEAHSLQAMRVMRTVAAVGQAPMPGGSALASGTLVGAASVVQTSPERLLW